jgi:hypothetical protein
MENSPYWDLRWLDISIVWIKMAYDIIEIQNA